MAIEYVAFGAYNDMVAEVGAFEMPSDWIEENNFKFAVLPIGDEQYDTQYFTTIDDAKMSAKEIADFYGIKMTRV